MLVVQLIPTNNRMHYCRLHAHCLCVWRLHMIHVTYIACYSIQTLNPVHAQFVCRPVMLLQAINRWRSITCHLPFTCTCLQ